jgi:hypothetical protein
MSARAAAWLAWITWALSIVLTVLSLWLLILNLSHPNVPLYLYWAEDTLLAVGYSTLGAVAASHRPGNPVGWVLCSIGLSWGWLISPASMPPTRCWQRPGRSRLLKPRPGSTPGFGFRVWVSSAVPQWSAAFCSLASIRLAQRTAGGGGNDYGGVLSGTGR